MADAKSTRRVVPVPDCPGYFVGDDGSLWVECADRCRRTGKSKHQGYLIAMIHDSTGQKRRRTVHSIVLTAFVGPRPDGMECRHLDGNRANARLDNLKWGTSGENHLDQRIHGTDNAGERNGQHKLTEMQVKAARILRRDGKMKYKDIASIFGVGITGIIFAIRGRKWKHVTDPAPVL